MKKNNLATDSPKIAAQWHPTKNGGLLPSQVTFSSGKKVWWQCDKGHEWESKIYNRTMGRGCPYCSGLKAIPGKTDLATVKPKIAAEWHPTKNGDLLPSQVAFSSGKKVWWLCANGHEWQASPNGRPAGRGCPYCSGRYVIPGETDLATVKPEIAAEWHPTKNDDLLPIHITCGSSKKVWWLCANGHEWQAIIESRTQGSGCPVCAREKNNTELLKRNGSLKQIMPLLASEWHPTKNGDLLPSQVMRGSHQRVWWQCTKEHEWQAAIKDRASGNGCPYCTGRYAIPGETDLATVKPKIAAEWHPTKNGDLLPSQVTFSSGKKVWWQCAKGHEWKATVYNRTAGRGCPYCSGRYAIPGETDLATVKPKIAAEWHPTKNGDLLPSQVAFSSGKKVWWQCTNGHEWQSTINNRTNHNTSCPYCKKR